MTIFVFVCAVLILRYAIKALAQAIPSRAVRCCIWSGLGLVMTVIGGIMVGYDKQFNNPNSFAPQDARTAHGIEIFFIGLLFVMVPWINWFWDSVFGAVRTATARIPSAQEINETLSAHYGRPATIDEVAAAQSIYVHNRNEAAAQAALGVGAFLLLQDAANRAKGL